MVTYGDLGRKSVGGWGQGRAERRDRNRLAQPAVWPGHTSGFGLTIFRVKGSGQGIPSCHHSEATRADANR